MEIIQFAIQREIESMDFYKKASNMVKATPEPGISFWICEAGRGHKKKLEEVQTGKIVLGKIEKVPNLKISDYLVEAELKPDISYGDILRIAMKRKNGR